MKINKNSVLLYELGVDTILNCKGNKLRHHTGIKQKHKKNFSLPYFLTNYLAFTLQLQSQNIHGCFVLSRNDFFRHDIPESIHGLRNMVRHLLHAVGEPLFVHYCVAQQNHHSALIPDSTSHLSVCPSRQSLPCVTGDGLFDRQVGFGT